MLQYPSASVETKASWAVASAALFILGMSFGAAWIAAVALKDIANEVGGSGHSYRNDMERSHNRVG